MFGGEAEEVPSSSSSISNKRPSKRGSAAAAVVEEEHLPPPPPQQQQQQQEQPPPPEALLAVPPLWYKTNAPGRGVGVIICIFDYYVCVCGEWAAYICNSLVGRSVSKQIGTENPAPPPPPPHARPNTPPTSHKQKQTNPHTPPSHTHTKQNAPASCWSPSPACHCPPLPPTATTHGCSPSRHTMRPMRWMRPPWWYAFDDGGGDASTRHPPHPDCSFSHLLTLLKTLTTKPPHPDFLSSLP